MQEAVSDIARLAQNVGDDTASALAEELADQLPRGDLNLLIVGQFKRGKSTLVNALLGDDVMPTGALPITGVVTAIRYGDERAIEVRLRHEQQPRRVPADDLALFVSEHYNPGNRLGVERVDVSWPSERIRGFVLFDTPGVGSTFEHNTTTARAALPRADAAVLVVGPDPPIGSEELRYAQEVVAQSEHLFVVLNKSDIAGNALKEVLDFTSDAVSQVVSDREEVDIIPLCATRARDAQRHAREDEAFQHFANLLQMFVNDHGLATRERSARRRALAILQRLDTLLAMRREALNLPRVEREHRRTLVERALQTFDDRVRSLELMVDDDVRRLRIALEEDMDRLHDRDRSIFCASAVELSKEPASRLRDERLEALIVDRVRVWREEAIERARRELYADATKYARLLGELEVAAFEAGCKALHVDAGELTPRNIVFAPAKLDLIASLVPTTSLELIVAFLVDLLPTPLREPILKRRYERTLTRELDAVRGKLRYGIAHDLEPWRRSVHATISEAIDSTRRVVLAAFGELAAGADAPEEPELERVSAFQHDIAAIRLELEADRLAC
jgi:Dynamin family